MGYSKNNQRRRDMVEFVKLAARLGIGIAKNKRGGPKTVATIKRALQAVKRPRGRPRKKALV